MTNSTEREIQTFFLFVSCIIAVRRSDRVDIEMHGRVCKFVSDGKTFYMLCNGGESTVGETIHTGTIEHFSRSSYIWLSSSSSLSLCRRFHKTNETKRWKRIEIDVGRIAHIAGHTYVAVSKMNCKWKPERYSNVSIGRPQWNPIYEEFFVLFPIYFFSKKQPWQHQLALRTNGCSSRCMWNCWKRAVSHLLWVCCFIFIFLQKSNIFVCAATASMFHNFPHRSRHWHQFNIRINTKCY